MDLSTIVAATFWLFSTSFWLAALQAALGLGLVIFVHELGHFLVAKWCGVKCEKFYVGFDVPIRIGPLRLPRALFRKQWGETEYGIGIIPLGGYVKMLGQDDNPANASREAERIRVAKDHSTDASSDSAKSADTASASQGESASSDTSQFELDPRSYPAKPVHQRMAIISAGVVMNLISAVLFGMIAYGIGVSYTPTEVGSVTPGLSAFQVGLQPGDQVLQIGRNGKRSEHLRFDKDMMVQVLMTGPHKSLDLFVRRHGQSEPEWVTVRTSGDLEILGDRPAVGIGPAKSLTIGEPLEEGPFLARPTAQPALEPGDRIVAVNGQPIADYPELLALLSQQIDQTLTLTIERPGAEGEDASAEPLEVKLPPRPMRGVGLVMTMGPVVSIQQGSPAERAGLQVGDIIESVQGEPVRDPMLLPNTLTRLAGQTVEMTVLRGDSARRTSVTLQIHPQPARQYQRDFAPWSPVASFAIGAAYQVLNEVARVEPGSAADAAGFEPGDILTRVDFVGLETDGASWSRRLDADDLAIVFEAHKTAWAEVWERMQWMPDGAKLKVHYERDGKSGQAELAPAELPGRFIPERGLILLGKQEIHRATSWGEAFRLGMRETWEGVHQVGLTLKKLITGEVAITKLGGPGTIIAVAGIEASHGTPRLLVFLTLLSANLAILNILPIPVLDGGHLMFLAYEAIFRKPVNERVALGLTMLGFSLLMGLMIFVLGMDLYRLTGIGG